MNIPTHEQIERLAAAARRARALSTAVGVTLGRKDMHLVNIGGVNVEVPVSSLHAEVANQRDEAVKAVAGELLGLLLLSIETEAERDAMCAEIAQSTGAL